MVIKMGCTESTGNASVIKVDECISRAISSLKFDKITSKLFFSILNRYSYTSRIPKTQFLNAFKKLSIPSDYAI
jgi:hypothetical protein